MEDNEGPGAAQLLLAIAEKRRLSSELLRSRSNPYGFASRESLDDCVRGLIGLGLVREGRETDGVARTWLTVTANGMRVAERLRDSRGQQGPARHNDIRHPDDSKLAARRSRDRRHVQ